MKEIAKTEYPAKLGTIKPNAELRESLDNIEKSKKLFEEGDFVGFLQTINEFYFGGDGKIEGPYSFIGSDVDEDKLDDSSLFNLRNSWGRVLAKLNWEGQDGGQSKTVSVDFGYSSKGNVYSIILYAEAFERTVEGGSLAVGKSIQRNFWIMPNAGMQEGIDDMLLTFVEELIESGIL